MLSRREVLVGGAALCAWPVAARADAEAATESDSPTQEQLDSSEFAYICPLRADGTESTCHGEVWYGWIAKSIVIITSKDSWKARALARGQRRARIWVGNHGRWKGLIFRNEAFRKAPHFDFMGLPIKNDDLLERLLALYETKYPAEIADWRDRMRSGYADGSRVMIRYFATG